jgi:hypothetical protein
LGREEEAAAVLEESKTIPSQLTRAKPNIEDPA